MHRLLREVLGLGHEAFITCVLEELGASTVRGFVQNMHCSALRLNILQEGHRCSDL